MRCPFCKHQETKVIDSRDAADHSLRRRRECLKCAKRFTTYERVETTNLLVVKKDGTREQFDREKLRRAITLPCEKLKISSERIDHALVRIEQKLAESRKGEVSSTKIGNLVMRELKKLDKVAYIRFAAVYREFADLADFETELGKLLKKTKGKRKK
ncbi:transcriptional repressor NrdR [Candidatus Woesearchaeota archaeon]|nr:transcriptional repressor NrdR [Candidatus Woesearchaeota archaeon]